MMMEIMGLHLPGAAFINPGTDLRERLTAAAAKRALSITAGGNEYTPVGRVVDEKAIVNAIVGLLATGGSTNHTLHIVAIARAAGIVVDWDDFDALSHAVPLLAHVYPSGEADVNQFHAAGGMSLIIRELLDAGLVHEDVMTVAGGRRASPLHRGALDRGGGRGRRRRRRARLARRPGDIPRRLDRRTGVVPVPSRRRTSPDARATSAVRSSRPRRSSRRTASSRRPPGCSSPRTR